VFFKMRRVLAAAFPVSSSSPPPPSPIPEPELTLAGVSISVGMRKAYLVPKAGGEGRRYSEGEEIQGWQISSITDDAIAFRMGKRVMHLLLYEESQ
jgi:type II secretory pathway component PulC